MRTWKIGHVDAQSLIIKSKLTSRIILTWKIISILYQISAFTASFTMLINFYLLNTNNFPLRWLSFLYVLIGKTREVIQSGIAGTGAVVVRAEEALIVVLVLILWVAAIALFFNRWGKIRMLEPYQPKFQQQHRQSCTIVDPSPLQVSASVHDRWSPRFPSKFSYSA